MTTPPIPDPLGDVVSHPDFAAHPTLSRPPTRIIGEPVADGRPAASPPLSLEQIKAEVRARHQQAVERLVELRKQRDRLNREIAGTIKIEAEARRIARSLEPRTRKAKK